MEYRNKRLQDDQQKMRLSEEKKQLELLLERKEKEAKGMAEQNESLTSQIEDK